VVSKFDVPQTQFERIKSPVKPTRSMKITVLSTFLESPLNFLSKDKKNTSKSSTVREKNGVQI